MAERADYIWGAHFLTVISTLYTFILTNNSYTCLEGEKFLIYKLMTFRDKTKKGDTTIVFRNHIQFENVHLALT